MKLEALSRKKLAVDASIWIYQFLKAVRDKEGNSLNLSHIVGFFRRICKLLYFGILPLFVFDGGAPALKRKVIQNRREKREGNREDMTTAAQRLLAIRIQKQMSSSLQTRKKVNGSGQIQTTDDKKNGTGNENDENSEFTYLSDMPLQLGQTSSSGIQPVVVPDSSPQRPFRKKDEYHLPALKNFKVRRGDERIMPKEEYDEYDDQYNWDVVDGIRIDSIDPSSQEFLELPMATQYMILSHLRLRSRLRLGYSKEQLEELFPNSQDFSRFQIQQVQKRNYYTQKLMNVSGMGEDDGMERRIAGDRNKLYALVKNDDGWTLSLGGDDDEKPIQLESEDVQSSPIKKHSLQKPSQTVAFDSEDDDLLEDVPLEDGGEEQELAVVDSIYEKYKDDYFSPPKIIPDNELKQYDSIELQLAIEASKEDYTRIKKKEQEAIAEFVGAHSDRLGFDLGGSILFSLNPNNAPDLGETKEPNLVEADSLGPTKKTNTVEADILGSGEENFQKSRLGESIETLEQIEEQGKPPPPKVNTIPSWFGAQSRLSNPFNETGFIQDKEVERDWNEEEEMGLINWADAKEMMKRPTEDAPGSDSSDIEIMEEVQLAQKVAFENKNDSDDVSEIHQKQLNSIEVSDHENPMKETEHKVSKSPNTFVDVGDSKEPQVGILSDHDKNSKGNPTAKNTKLSGSGNIIKSLGREGNVGAKEERDANDETGRTKEKETKNKEFSLDIQKHDSGMSGDKHTVTPPQKKAILPYDIDEDEEELLIQLMHEEEQEHANFASSLRTSTIPISTAVTEEQLLQEKLMKAKRDAEEVTETMINDVQELLKRFGIPFITAPMEAEAQCAELYSMGMVDGIITDDSDCFLFGGSRVYKNMFNQKQYVECYIAEDIEHKIGLDRKKLIELALLLGSDYTEGIKGVGPVLAMEILAEFGDLKKFKQWFDKHTKRVEKPGKDTSKLEKTLLTRIKGGKLFLPDTFPDPVVANAYTHADVDKDDSEFKWGIPRLDQIRSFLMYNVHWSQERVDEVMVPLIQNMNRQRQEGKQSTIGEFFPQEYISYKKDVGLGKRMKVAAQKLKGG